ncbi:MAG: hypothetical protein ACREIB_07060, partial [Pseudomonadota bacterium]
MPIAELQQQHDADASLNLASSVSTPDRILPQQLDLVRAAMPVALVAQTGMIVACLVVLWSGPARGPAIAGWAAVAILITLGRAILLWRWPKTPLSIAKAPGWRRLVMIAAVTSGAAWGVLPVLIEARAPIEQQMFL